MSGVFFLGYVRSLSTCLFKYVFLFILFIFLKIYFKLIIFLATPYGMWNLISPTRDGTCVLCNGRQVLNHCTTREVSACLILILSIFNDPLLQKSKYIAWDWKKKYEHLTVMESCPYVGGYTLSITSFTPETVLKGRHCLLHRWKTETQGVSQVAKRGSRPGGIRTRQLASDPCPPSRNHSVVCLLWWEILLSYCRWGYGN